MPVFLRFIHKLRLPKCSISAMNLLSLKPRRRMRIGKQFTKTAMFEG